MVSFTRALSQLFDFMDINGGGGGIVLMAFHGHAPAGANAVQNAPDIL